MFPPIHALLLTATAAFAPPANAQGDLVQLVPVDAHSLVRVQNATTVLEQIERNDIYRLLGDEAGEPLYNMMRSMSPPVFDVVIALGKVVPGEAVAFTSKTSQGMLVEPKGSRVQLLSTLRSLTGMQEQAENPPVQWLAKHRIESSLELDLKAAAPAGSREAIPLPAVSPEETPLTWALIDGPRFVATIQGPRAIVEAWIRGLCSVEEERAPSPIAAKLLAARKLHGPAGQVEGFVDFSVFEEEATNRLRSIDELVDVNLFNLLGLDSSCYLYSALSLPPGLNIDCRAHLNITPGTLLARLADTMKPLPADLLGKLPSGITGLHCMNWDLNQCYALILDALKTGEEEEGAERIESLVAAALGTGNDAEEQLLSQFEGLFGMYFCPPEKPIAISDIERDWLGVFMHVGLFARVKDTELVAKAFKSLLGRGISSEVSTVDRNGYEAIVLPEGPIDGGVAFGMRHMIAAVTRRVLDKSLETFRGGAPDTLLSGGTLQAIFDSRQGSSGISAFRLGMLRQLINERDRAVEIPEGMERLYETYLATSLRRVRSGFEVRIQLH